MLVFKNLLRRKVRTLLSILGIAIGIAAIIAFNAVGRGFRESLNRYMRESGAQLIVVNKNMKDPVFSRISAEQQEFIRSLPEVEHLSKANVAIAGPGAVKRGAGITALVVFGRTPGDRLLEKFRARVRGRLMEREGEAMVGSLAAEQMGVGAGDSLEIFDQTLRVVGVYESSIPWEGVGVIVPNAFLQGVLHFTPGSVYMGFLYLRPGSDWRGVKAKVEGQFPQLRALQTEEFTVFYDQLEYIDWFVWIISLVSVVVGGLGVLNTMLMAVSERTREIGTLRAVGWSRARVLRMVLAEGVLLSVIGGVIGLGVGAAGAEVLIRWAPQGFLGTEYAPLLFVQAFAVALGLGFVGALYPAYQASRLSPIEALKYE